MSIFRHPLTSGLHIDDPENTILRREIVRTKPFLRSLYSEWYRVIWRWLPDQAREILEIGSGPGFLKEMYPSVMTSEVFPLDDVDRVVDATNMLMGDSSLDAIVMTDVFHHIPDVERFLSEVVRVLRVGGRLIMIEPWPTTWSSWVYRRLHHEPFHPDTLDWRLPEGGPLSVANSTLPWIVFERDREVFKRMFPTLKILTIEQTMPLAYLLSGGVSLRALVPGWLYNSVRFLERSVLRERGAMFALIVVENCSAFKHYPSPSRKRP